MVTFEYQAPEGYEYYNAVLAMQEVDTGKYTDTWPERSTNQVTCIVPEGRYLTALALQELESYYAGEETETILLIATDEGWKVLEGQISREEADAYAIEIKDGDVVELEIDSLESALMDW